jgi:1-acyl-sn-glycerol-3-phosphate acyltransferase
VKILIKLYTVYVIIVFFITMIILLPGILIPFLFGRKFSWIGYSFLWIWSWVFSMLTFIRYDFLGTEYLNKNQSCIYVSNHTSFLDIPGIRLIIPGEFRPIAKKELLKIPIFGFIVRAATVVVDRSSAQSRKKSMEKLHTILTNGVSILVFAEGTQNRTKEILQPFKDGAFRIAIDTQLPIVPLVVVGAGPLMPPGAFSIKPGRIKVIVGEPIPVTGLTTDDTQTLKQQVFDAMLGIYKQHS